MLYPLKFHPVYKDYLWGGRNLERLGRRLPPGIIAESWEIAGLPDGTSVIANGELAGVSLPDFCRRFGREALGDAVPERFFNEFPLLVKLIDANRKLSVQVHPDDWYAAEHEGGFGKNEMWYIIAAQPGATIIYDVLPGTTPDSFAAAIRENRVESCLQTIPVVAGDVIDIPSGVVHGLGEGILLAEIQQSSNLTYRIYDYDRVDATGQKRPLHLKQALDVIDFNVRNLIANRPGGVIEKNSSGIRKRLVANRFFDVELFEWNDTWAEKAAGDRFVLYTFLRGAGEIVYSGGTVAIQAPESVMIPAAMGSYSISGQLTYLKVMIP